MKQEDFPRERRFGLPLPEIKIVEKPRFLTSLPEQISMSEIFRV